MSGRPAPKRGRVYSAEIWADIRRRYETSDEAVDAIAAHYGMTSAGIYIRRKKEGWTIRHRIKAPPPPPPPRQPLNRAKWPAGARLCNRCQCVTFTLLCNVCGASTRPGPQAAAP